MISIYYVTTRRWCLLFLLSTDSVTWANLQLAPERLQTVARAVETAKGGGGVIAEAVPGHLSYTARLGARLPLTPRRPATVHCAAHKFAYINILLTDTYYKIK